MRAWPDRLADLVTVIISYVSIVLGELTAKRFALQRTESIAMALAPMVDSSPGSPGR